MDIKNENENEKIPKSTNKSIILLEENQDKFRNNFKENHFWKKIYSISKRTTQEIIYNMLILFYTLKSQQISLKKKALIVAGLGYFISPIDLIPDFIPVLGLSDDLIVSIYLINLIKELVTPEILESTRLKFKQIFKNIDDFQIKKFENPFIK